MKNQVLDLSNNWLWGALEEENGLICAVFFWKNRFFKICIAKHDCHNSDTVSDWLQFNYYNQIMTISKNKNHWNDSVINSECRSSTKGPACLSLWDSDDAVFMAIYATNSIQSESAMPFISYAHSRIFKNLNPRRPLHPLPLAWPLYGFVLSSFWRPYWLKVQEGIKKGARRRHPSQPKYGLSEAGFNHLKCHMLKNPNIQWQGLENINLSTVVVDKDHNCIQTKGIKMMSKMNISSLKVCSLS